MVGLSLLFVCGSVALNESIQGKQTGVTPTESPSHYCGLHCVYAAARLHGVNLDFTSIVDPMYLSGRYGSTSTDITSALQKAGLVGCTEGYITLQRLRLLDAPAILHVRSIGTGPAYNHWVLFLGFEGDKVRLYDPPRDHGVVSTAELLSMWDGVGIIVRKAPSRFCAPVPVSALFLSAAVIVGALLRRLSRSLHGVKSFVLVAAIVAIAFHAVAPRGFLQSSDALNNVKAAFVSEIYPDVTFDEMLALFDSDDCQVIDARMASAYASFHLPHAVNIPVDSGYIRFMRAFASIDRHKPVVVYCQSDACDWADRVADQLSARGIRDIRIYRGGVRDWKSRQQQHEHDRG